MASSLSDAYICGADIRFSDKYVRSDQHNFNTDYLLSGTVSPHENSAFLFAVGPSLNNKVFRFSAMDQTGEGLLSYDEKGDSPCFVFKSVAACRFVCYESEGLIKRTYAPVAKDFSALLEEYEKCLLALQGKEWARTSFVNCFANEVYNWFALGREGTLFALKNEERIKKNPVTSPLFPRTVFQRLRLRFSAVRPVFRPSRRGKACRCLRIFQRDGRIFQGRMPVCGREKHFRCGDPRNAQTSVERSHCGKEFHCGRLSKPSRSPSLSVWAG